MIACTALMLATATSLVAARCVPQEPRTATVQLPPKHVATGAMLVDVNDDGQTDLVLACRNKTTGQRSLRTHLRQKGRRVPAFASKPSRTPFAVDRDVVAFAFCDCTVEPGRELILLTPERVVAAVPGEDGAPSYQRLFHHRLIWPAALASSVIPLPDAAVDFDGDGRTDLLLPQPNGWTVHFQDRDGSDPVFVRSAERTLPPRQDQIRNAVKGRGVAASSGSLELRFGGDTGGKSGPLVSASTRTPKCDCVDLNGDGKLDLVMQRNGDQHTAIQDKQGTLAEQTRAMPLSPNRLKIIDPAFNVQWPDVDGDRTADLMLTTSAQRDDDVEARVDLFRTRKDGTWPDKPDARLRMQALARSPQIVDADGDGTDDLVCITLRTSTMSALTGGKSESFEAQLNIFRGDGKQFVKPSMLSLPLPLTTNSSLSQPFLIVRPGRRGRAGDVLLHIGNNLERRFLNRSGEQLELAAADSRTPVPKKARILLADAIGDEILILDGEEVRHVRFRR